MAIVLSVNPPNPFFTRIRKEWLEATVKERSISPLIKGIKGVVQKLIVIVDTGIMNMNSYNNQTDQVTTSYI